MNSTLSGPLTLRVETERWLLTAPFRIAGHTFAAVEVLVVSLEKNGHVGRGEAAGVYYRNDNPSTMSRQIELLRARIEAGISRDLLQHALGPGGARNALDCAWWDLQAKLSGRSVWQLAGLEKPRPLRTTFTCGADTPQAMASTAGLRPRSGHQVEAHG
jgi:L-Ala-D/L-Glu epimerase